MDRIQSIFPFFIFTLLGKVEWCLCRQFSATKLRINVPDVSRFHFNLLRKTDASELFSKHSIFRLDFKRFYKVNGVLLALFCDDTSRKKCLSDCSPSMKPMQMQTVVTLNLCVSTSPDWCVDLSAVIYYSIGTDGVSTKQRRWCPLWRFHHKDSKCGSIWE